MPVHDFECQETKCGHKFTEYLTKDEPEPEKCPKCSSTKIQKVFNKAPTVMGKQRRT